MLANNLKSLNRPVPEQNDSTVKRDKKGLRDNRCIRRVAFGKKRDQTFADRITPKAPALKDCAKSSQLTASNLFASIGPHPSGMNL